MVRSFVCDCCCCCSLRVWYLSGRIVHDMEQVFLYTTVLEYIVVWCGAAGSSIIRWSDISFVAGGNERSECQSSGVDENCVEFGRASPRRTATENTRLIQDSKNFRMKTRNSHYSSLVMSTFVWHIVVCIGRQKREGYFIAALPPSPVVFIVLNNKFCAFSIRVFFWVGGKEQSVVGTLLGPKHRLVLCRPPF